PPALRRALAPVREGALQGSLPEGAFAYDGRGARRMGGPQAGPAERGTAAARCDRSGSCERPRDRMGGRADREPRLRDVGPDHGPPRAPESGAGPDARPRVP